MRRFSLLVAVGCLALATPRLASAQGDPASGDTARIHLGPLGLKPRIALDRIGVDTNVDNDPVNGQRDFTIGLVPGVDSFLPIGRGLLTGKTSYELQYFQHRADGRAANLSQAVRFDLGLARFTPFVSTDYLSTNRRPSPEIDARVHQTTKSVGVGASARIGGRTDVRAAFMRSTYAVDHLTFDDVDLSDALGRRTDLMSASIEHALTPLTTFSFNTAVQHDRFPASPLHSADIMSVTSGVTLKPSALISGHASLGFTRLQPLNPEVPTFTGVTAGVDLSYVWQDWTKFNIRVDRSTSYSFEMDAPYYVVTGFSLGVAQNLGSRFDLLGRFGRQYLDYRQIASAVAADDSGLRRDRTVTYGSGLEYRMSQDTRVGFTVDYDRRMSPIESRHYDGYRFGGSFTYAY